MNRETRRRGAWLAVLGLALSLTGSTAEAGGAAQRPLAEQDVWLRWKAAHDARESARETGSGERASTAHAKGGLVGMPVRDANGESLGRIKDLVIDWETDPGAEGVVSTTPKALIGLAGNLVTVPLSALKSSHDQKYLILNVQKSQIAGGTGAGSEKARGGAEP